MVQILVRLRAIWPLGPYWHPKAKLVVGRETHRAYLVVLPEDATLSRIHRKDRTVSFDRVEITRLTMETLQSCGNGYLARESIRM